MQSDVKRPLPALWNYLARVYQAMEDEAEIRPLYDDRDEEGLVYEGHLTQLFRDLGIPNPYYTSVTRALKGMGNIAQLRRGGGPSTSRWALIGPPDKETFITFSYAGKMLIKHKGRNAVIEQRLRDLTKRLTRLEDIVYNYLEGNDGTEAGRAQDSPAASDGSVRAQDVTDEERSS